MHAEAAPQVKRRPGRPRKYPVGYKPPQSSYLGFKLDAAKQQLAHLLQTVTTLQSDNAQLCTQLTAYAAGMQALDAQLSRASRAAAEWSLGRQAQELLRQQKRMAYSLASLPPPDQWDTSLLAHFKSLGPEHLRYMILTSYREGRELLQTACMANVASVDALDDACKSRLDVHGSKLKCFAYCFINMEGVRRWSPLVGANLETGEPDSTPPDWYLKVAGAVPRHQLPPGFHAYLQLGIRLYRSRMQQVISRRHELGLRLAALMQKLVGQTCPASEGALGQARELIQLAHRRGQSVGAQSCTPAPSAQQPAACSEGLAVSRAGQRCNLATPHGHRAGSQQGSGQQLGEAERVEAEQQLEATVREIEETIVCGFRNNQILSEYVLQKLPERILTVIAAASAPHHAYLPSILEGLLSLCETEQHAAQASSSMSNPLPESSQLPPVQTPAHDAGGALLALCPTSSPSFQLRPMSSVQGGSLVDPLLALCPASPPLSLRHASESGSGLDNGFHLMWAD